MTVEASQGVLPEHAWRPLAEAHVARVSAWTQPYLDRRSRGVAHPVDDFLWTYYSHRPKALLAWHPGLGVTLTGDVSGLAAVRGWMVTGTMARIEPALFARRADQVREIRDLLLATAGRPPALACFGLHEWAMVYRLPAGARRHEAYPLRLGQADTDEVVRTSRIICTHFDAFRFFTPDAMSLNGCHPTRATAPSREQAGCLHATMDLYKHAYGLGPAVPGDLLLACFDLARQVRQLDMAASPYDLRSLGIDPVPIETPWGRAEYAARQRQFSLAAEPLRRRLLAIARRVAGEPVPAPAG